MIIIRELGKLNTYIPIYRIECIWDNFLKLRHTLDNIYLTSILEFQRFILETTFKRERVCNLSLKYIVCDVCGLRSPSFESSSVLYISPTNTSSMQNLILEGLQQKLQKSCSRCNKNTRHVESSYILQPPKYLLLFVNRFRYINNNFTKDRCSIPMDTTVRLGPLKLSLQATIDHHGPSIHSGHYTASINCCKKNILLQRSHNYGVWNY